jgi:hypothetical protein
MTIIRVETIAKEIAGKLQAFEREREKLVKDDRLRPEMRARELAALEGRFSDEVAALRAEAREHTAEIRAEADRRERELLRSARPAPNDAAEWTEAAARASFVREDLERMAGTRGAVAEALRHAHEDGDRVGAYLLIRYSEQVDLGAYPHLPGEIGGAVAELWPVDALKLARIREDSRRAAEIGMEIANVTPRDAQDLAAKFGI